MNFWSDFRYAIRVLSKDRAFTLISALTLAVSTGANTAIFSMADAIVFRPYPFRDLSRIVALGEIVPAAGPERYGVTPANYFDWEERNHVFGRMAAYRFWAAILTGSHDPQRVRAVLVSPDFFPLLALAPAQGRVFSGNETGVNGRNEVVLSYGFWQERLGSDPRALGKSLSLNGASYTVIGIMPKEMDFPMYAEIWALWIPTPQERNDRTAAALDVIARLKPGISLAQARSEMSNIGARLTREYPQSNAGRNVSVLLLRDSVDAYAGRFMSVITGAVIFLLLLACANVANLQLARGAARRREMALRMALGASRLRIVFLLVTEGLMLSLFGAAVGLPLAIWGVTAIKAGIPEMVSRHLPGLLLVGLDARMLGFTLAAAILASIAFTLPAALQVFRDSPGRALKEAGRTLVGPSGRSMRSGLVIAEAAFSIVLLVGAGLMVEGFRNLSTMNAGFEARDVVTFRVSLPRDRYPDAFLIVNYYRELLRRLQGIPGMGSAAVISELPALADRRSSPILIEGHPAPPPERPLLAEVRITSEDYFRTMTIPILEGRRFERQDAGGGAPAVILSKTAAERFWPGQKPLGRRVRLTSAELNTGWLTVVGIAGDVRHFLLDREIRPIFYLPYQQQPLRSLNVVMRIHASLDKTAVAARAAAKTVDPAQPLDDLERVDRFFADLTGAVGVIAALLGIFAAIALALAAAGIYAVMAYSVAQRREEIGIRMALGARPQDVRRLIVGNALGLVGAGLGIGLPAAFALTTLVSSILPGIVAVDALTFAGFAILLSVVALLASLIPSQRAIRTDPLMALRSE